MAEKTQAAKTGLIHQQTLKQIHGPQAEIHNKKEIPIGCGTCGNCSNVISAPCPLEKHGSHALGKDSNCKFCADHLKFLDLKSKGETWWREESPFQIASELFLHRNLIEYGPFTYRGSRACIDTLNAALDRNLQLTPFAKFSEEYIRKFIAILRTSLQTDSPLATTLTKYIAPTKPQLDKAEDPNANYQVNLIAHDFGHQLTQMCLLLFQSLTKIWKSERGLADKEMPYMVAEMMDDSYLTTSLFPYAKMITYSWNEFQNRNDALMDIHNIEEGLRWHFDGTLTLAKWSKDFSDWIKSDNRNTAIFLGSDPYNNANLKAMANVGSQMFDSMSVVFAHAYNIGNIDRTNNEAAPNGTMVEMYDNVVKYHSVTKDPPSAIGRHWNNKGNSMETLALAMFEDGKYALLWFTAFITFNATYQQSAHPNIRTI